MAYNRLMEKVSLYYKLAQYGDRKNYLKAIGQASLSGPVPPIPGTPVSLGDKLKGTYHPVQSPTQTLPEYTPPADAAIPTINVEDLPKTPPTLQYPAIDKTIQDQLNQLLVPTGNIMALKLDESLGPQTRAALQAFQSKYNMPATPANIKAQFLKEKHPELETKTPF